MFEQYVRVVEHCLKKEMVGKRMEGLWDQLAGISEGNAGGTLGVQLEAI